MLKDKLCQIGLTEGEASIYLELLRIGLQAVSVIAKRTTLNRTTAYSILKSLQQKGLVSCVRKDNIKYFCATDPNCLIGYIDRKCRTYDYYRNEMLMTVSQFRDLSEKSISDKQPVVSYYEGLNGVKFLIDDALNCERICRSYLSLHKWFKCGLKDYLLKYKNKRVNDKKVKLKALAPDTDEIRSFFLNNYDKNSGMTEIMYVSDESWWGIFEHEMNIYGDKVAILYLDKGNEYGVLIESDEIARMYKAIFDLNWKTFASGLI